MEKRDPGGTAHLRRMLETGSPYPTGRMVPEPYRSAHRGRMEDLEERGYVRRGRDGTRELTPAGRDAALVAEVMES